MLIAFLGYTLLYATVFFGSWAILSWRDSSLKDVSKFATKETYHKNTDELVSCGLLWGISLILIYALMDLRSHLKDLYFGFHYRADDNSLEWLKLRTVELEGTCVLF